MSAAIETIPQFYTAADMERFPDDVRYELIRGELCPMPPPGAEHGSITARLSSRVTIYIEDNELGECFAAETRFVIEQNPDTVLAPDFAFISKERLPAKLPKGFLRIAPDIVLETRSPGDTKREVSLKVARWLQAGAKIVWVIDPETRTLTVHRSGMVPRILGLEDMLTGEEVLPGFTLPIRRLFRDAEG